MGSRCGPVCWMCGRTHQSTLPSFPLPLMVDSSLSSLGSFSRSLWHTLSSHLSQHIKLLKFSPASHTTLLPCQAQVSQIARLWQTLQGLGPTARRWDRSREEGSRLWVYKPNHFNCLRVIAFSMHVFFVLLKPCCSDAAPWERSLF